MKSLRLSPHRIVLKILLLIFSSQWVHAQCDYAVGDSPTFNIVGNNTNAGFNTVVVATDPSGTIKYVSSVGSGTISNLAEGIYNIYSVNYASTSPPTIAIGSNISTVTGDCVDLSAPVRIGVCACTDQLSNGTRTLAVSTSGASTDPAYTNSYVLVDSTGYIKGINATGSFDVTQQGLYNIYRVNYLTSAGISGLSVGSPFSGVSSDCFMTSGAVGFKVCAQEGGLPVTLSSFKARKDGETAQLEWTTSLERNTSHFQIERSIDTKNWESIGSRTAIGESVHLNKYEFTDYRPSSGVNYYRLKMVDKDGTYVHSRAQSILFGNSPALMIYPNPASDRVYISGLIVGTVSYIKLGNISGNTLYYRENETETSLSVKEVPTGMYYLQIGMKDGSVYTRKITVTHQ